MAIALVALDGIALVAVVHVPVDDRHMLDFYLIARLIVDNEVISLFFSLVLFGIFAALWLFLPRSNALQRLLRRSS